MSTDDNTHTYRLEHNILPGEDGLYEWAPGIRVTEDQVRWLMAEAAERAGQILADNMRGMDFIEGMGGKRTRERLQRGKVYTAPKGADISAGIIDEGGPWTQVGWIDETHDWMADDQDPRHDDIRLPDITQLMTIATVSFSTPTTPELMHAMIGDIMHPLAERRHIPPIRSIKWATKCTSCKGEGGSVVAMGYGNVPYSIECSACGGTGKRKDQLSRDRTRARMVPQQGGKSSHGQ